MADSSCGEVNTCRVSIIMPAFNAATTIGEAITSALAQTEIDVELIIIDDASTDDTVRIADGFAHRDRRVRVLRRTVNGGPAAARNHGFEAARGQWIAVLHADDLYAPQRLQRLIALAEATAADIVSDNLMVHQAESANPPYLLISPDRLPSSRRLHTSAFVEGNTGTSRTRRECYGFMQPLVKRAFLKRHGIRYDVRNRFGEDYLFSLKCLLAGARWWITPEALYYYHVTPDTATAKQSSTDLRRISLVEQALLGDPAVRADSLLTSALRRHKAKIDHNYFYRAFTDAVKAHEYRTAASLLFTSTASLVAIVGEAIAQAPVIARKFHAGGYGGTMAPREQVPEPSRARTAAALPPAKFIA